MLKRLFSIFILGLLPLSADIIKITEIEDVRSKIDKDTVVFFNLAEVVIDSKISLGTQPWRKFVRKIDPTVHDWLTHFIFAKGPVKAVEPTTPTLIQEFQQNGNPVFGLTSRGRKEWYGLQISNVDLLTEKRLKEIGVDFSKTKVPAGLVSIQDSEFYHEGILYATNSVDKGELLTQIFTKAGFIPSKVVFIDDKADSLVEVEKALEKLGIPFVGFAYSRTARDHADFDPYIPNIQLLWYQQKHHFLSDEEAARYKYLFEKETSADAMFRTMLDSVQWQNALEKFLNAQPKL